MSRFMDEKLLGEGGFAEVWQCRHESTGKRYAKKKLRANASTEAIRRFAREARILSKLDHPNIVRVAGVRLESPPYFYIMPLYAHSLTALMGELSREPSRLRKIFEAVLSGVEYAHEQGVLHRDLNPNNVLTNSDDDVVVSDFGLGRVVDSASSTLRTVTGAQMGTPGYFAPEQLSDARQSDQRTDVFALGRILYALYGGNVASSAIDMDSLPGEIAFVVTKCTEPNPDKRFQTVTDLRRVWKSLFETVEFSTEQDRIRKLAVELSEPVGSDVAKKASCLLVLLAKHRCNGELLHDVIMTLDPEVVVAFFDGNRRLARQLLRGFADWTANKGWPFSYTDRIGNQLRSLYHLVPDPEIKAELLACLLEVGYGHNRWYVMDIFNNLFADVQDPQIAVPLAERLRAAPRSIRSALLGRVQDATIAPVLREAIRHDGDEQEETFP